MWFWIIVLVRFNCWKWFWLLMFRCVLVGLCLDVSCVLLMSCWWFMLVLWFMVLVWLWLNVCVWFCNCLLLVFVRLCVGCGMNGVWVRFVRLCWNLCSDIWLLLFGGGLIWYFLIWWVWRLLNGCGKFGLIFGVIYFLLEFIFM